MALLALADAAKDNSGNIGGSFDIMTMGGDRQFRFKDYELSEVDPAFAVFHDKLTAAFDEFRPITASTIWQLWVRR